MKTKFQFPDIDFDPNNFESDELKQLLIDAIEEQAKLGIISPDEYRTYIACVDLWVIQLMEIEQ